MASVTVDVTPAREGGFGFFSTLSDNHLLAGDFDGDDDDDLMIASFGAIQGFWNDGLGGFTSSGQVLINPSLWLYTVADVGATVQARIVGMTRDGPPELRVVGFDAEHKPVVFPGSAPVAECFIEATVAARFATAKVPRRHPGTGTRLGPGAGDDTARPWTLERARYRAPRMR